MAQLRAELADHPGGIGAAPVALVDEGDAGHPVALHLMIHRDRLRLNAAYGTEDQHRAVQHPEGTFDLDGEIHMPRGVDDVDLMVQPGAERRRRGDGDASLLFQLHGVHGRADAVFALDVVDGVNPFCIEQYPLRQGGLPRVDMGADPDIPDIFQFVGHTFSFFNG